MTARRVPRRRRQVSSFVPTISPGEHGPGPSIPPAGRPGLVRFTAAAVLLFIVCTLLAACGHSGHTSPPSSLVPLTVGIGVLPPVLETVTTDGATATTPAVRVNPPTSVESAPPVDWDALAAAEYSGYPCSQWAGKALAAGWPVEQMPKVLRTMWRESRCRWDVRSSTADSGLMQINDIVLTDWRFHRDWPGFDRSTIFDPSVNLAVAYWLFTIDGWRPWSGGA